MKNIVYILGILFLTNSCNSQNKLSEEQKMHLQQLKQNFVFVEGGEFVMGKDYLPEANPAHQVTLDSYSIHKYETTFKEYDLYTTLNELENVMEKYRDQKDMAPNFGVGFISWHQAREYCLWLGKELNLPIDLPTEAQWEYAARSRGLDIEHATNNGKIEGGDKDNYGDGEVGSYPPNPLGVYDMSGGRPEWVRDWFFSYDEEPKTNPVQDSIRYSKKKIIRGWHTLSNSVYGRGTRKPDFEDDLIGFRCVCNQKTPIE